MKIKSIVIALGVIGLAYYGYDRWKRRKNTIVKQGTFTIEVEPYEEPIK